MKLPLTDKEYLLLALDRFYKWVVIEATERVAGLGPCHWWVGARTRGGPHWSQRKKGGKLQRGAWYGTFHVRRPRSLRVRVHRWLYEQLIGPIPSDSDGNTYELDHLCNNTLCVNLKHLEPKPGRKNAARANSGRKKVA